MRLYLALLFALVAWGQPQASNFQPGWPCTGKGTAFDPSYGKLAESTGGHLFLFDKSEVAAFSSIAIGDMQHTQTIARVLGRSESFQDLRFPVDSSIESIFVVAWIECLQTVQIYGPDGRLVMGDQGKDQVFRGGRIATISHPQAGDWILRIAGAGAHSIAVQARTERQMKRIHVKNEADGKKTISLWLDPTVNAPALTVLRADGSEAQPVSLIADPDVPRHFSATFVPAFHEFRIMVNAADGFQRVDPRLFTAASE